MHATLHLMRQYGFPALSRRLLETLQVNVGYKCNQTCVHCHVNAGPHRTEEMSRETLADVVAFIAISSIPNLDITGGAPELNAHFRTLVAKARELGVHVIDRCNLTVLLEPGHEDLAAFLHRGARRPPARQGCLREEHASAQAPERARLRRAEYRARAESRLQPA